MSNDKPCSEYVSSAEEGYGDGTVDCATCGFMEKDHIIKKVNVAQVEAVITTLANIPNEKRPLTPEGSLDIDKLNEMDEVKAVVAQLKGMGVRDGSHLRELGFIVGAMILKF